MKKNIAFFCALSFIGSACQFFTAPALPEPSIILETNGNRVVGNDALDDLLKQDFDEIKIFVPRHQEHATTKPNLDNLFLDRILEKADFADAAHTTPPVPLRKGQKEQVRGEVRLRNLLYYLNAGDDLSIDHLNLLIHEEFWLPVIENSKKNASQKYNFIPIRIEDFELLRDEHLLSQTINTLDAKKILERLKSTSNTCHPDYRSGYRCPTQYQAVINFYKAGNRVNSIWLSLNGCDVNTIEFSTFVNHLVDNSSAIEGFCLIK
jgi:REP element-mobilizing transposase RayT